MGLNFAACDRALFAEDMLVGGRITHVTGSTIEAILPRAQTGSIYRISGKGQREDLLAEVIGFRERETILAPFGEPRGISPDDPVMPEGLTDEQRVSDDFLGRIVDALGRPLDDKPPPVARTLLPLYRPAPNPLERRTIDETLVTGVGIIDALNTVGRGQRIGIFAGAGVGKSTLMGMLARHAESDVNVIALVGERGREVKSFIENELGPEGMARSVLVVATGDVAPILRVRAAFLATTLAEYFREQGRQVTLMMDSLTRLAHALREIGLSAGEPPTTRGYPPSVFSVLPRILERSGNARGKGSITAFYTVLVDGDDMNEPIADCVKSILDGHLILSNKLAKAGRYPAVEPNGSLSRLAHELMEDGHADLAKRTREVFATHEELADLINVGAFKSDDKVINEKLKAFPRLVDYFKQERGERRGLEQTLGGLATLLGPKS